MPRGRSLLLSALVGLAGCGPRDAPAPSSTDSKAALQASLEAWKSGKPMRATGEFRPPVECLDHDWLAGKALDDFTVVEETADGGVKTYAVTLTLKGSAPIPVRYMAFGQDPHLPR